MVLLSVEVEYILEKMTLRVDRFSREHVVPLHVRKFGDLFSSEDFKFGELEIERVILDHFLVSSWLGVRKHPQFIQRRARGKSVSSGARFLGDPCPTGDSALGLSVPSFAGGSSSPCSESDPYVYLAPCCTGRCHADQTW